MVKFAARPGDGKRNIGLHLQREGRDEKLLRTEGKGIIEGSSGSSIAALSGKWRRQGQSIAFTYPAYMTDRWRLSLTDALESR